MATDKNFTNNQARNFILSKDPKVAMQEMMETIDALRTLYMEENDALNRADTTAFMSLQDKKIGLARTYQDSAVELMERKDEFAGQITVDLRKNLEAKQEEFSAVTRENLDALERMRKSTQRLGNRIIQAARDTVKRDSHAYGAKGKLEAQSRTVSIGLNESA